ncbi:MAG: TldD/PmbA family protein [Casimicrobiaceae bacterium]
MPDADHLIPDPLAAVPPGFDVDFWSLRLVEETSETYAVRKNVPQPLAVTSDRGVMATVYAHGGYGYAATCDVSPAGVRAALERAAQWARSTARHKLLDTATLPRPAARGTFASPGTGAGSGAGERPPADWFDFLMRESAAAAMDPRIVDWDVSIEWRHAVHRLVTSAGGDVMQTYRFVFPGCAVTAHAGGDTQTRTLNGYRGICQQGGEEVLERFGFAGCGKRIAEEALELVLAPNCPSGTMDVLLMPDQMILQLHESIGHPLELDRILGDERNFAGTSFVTSDMFGTYRYGSPLLDVTFDPTRPEQLASYGWDDDGAPAEKVYLIRAGLLERPLGGTISQARAGLAGTANARADNWNRPPIDRMANLNIEPGDASLDAMIGDIDDGVLMATNRSWSIDDSRNKFQFGCERGQRIRAGKLGGVVKNPNYRGISANFWRNLVRVGDASTLQVLGTPYCGKGEPSQIIRVGHASPACVFSAVDVFGGAA